ncbi:alpha-mannosidase [Spirochaetia bacterium]|nr:alpha-mannosidase [Spirochaetia bacterium]
MFKDFIVEKIARQAAYLEELRYQNIIPVTELTATPEPENFKYPGFLSPGRGSHGIHTGDFWSGRDTYLWLHCTFEVPKDWGKQEFLGVFDFGVTGGGYNSGFESLLYLNGSAYQGVDSNHQEVFFAPGPNGTGKTLTLDFRLWSGLEGGGKKQEQYHQIKKAFFCTLEPSVDELYYLLLNMTAAIQELPEDVPARHRLESILTGGYKLLDFTEPGSGAFVVSARKTLDYYRKTLKEADGARDISVSFIGHTHIDLSWLWRYKHTREKAERSFSTVLRLMERYPEYIFLQTQAQLYDSVKQDYPELFKAIKQRVADKRWEASGSMWVEADCNIPSGESLVRQILYGKGFFKREFGVENRFLWLPDVFGYSWALPQILKKSGIDTFITTKISWSEINRMPHDTFLWTGIDGSVVLTHFITTPDDNKHYYTYNGKIEPRYVKGIWSNYQDKAINQDLLLSYGYGDGGGGVTRTMLENLRAIAKLPGLPAVKTETVADYLERLHKTVAHPANARLVHNWERELYLEYHRGTYTSQAYTKKMNRRLELLFRDAEILSSLGLFKNKEPEERDTLKLREGWKLILKAQFHDIIPGSSIGEVYEDTRRDHHAALALGTEVLDSALAEICEKDKNSYSVINTAGWKRSGLAKIPLLQKDTHLAGEAGPLLTQNSDYEGKPATYVHIPAVLPLGAVPVTIEPGASAEKALFKIQKNSVDTPYYYLKWNSKGQIVSLIDKSAGREVLWGPGNQLQIFEDRPRSNDAWEIEASIDEKREIISNLVSCTCLETGALFTRIRFIWTYGKSKITQDLILYSVHKRIDFKTEVDWQERSKLLKTAFPVDIRSVNARYEIQYGSLERAAHRSTSWDEAQFEVVGHQWADYSEKDFGVSLMNDSKYGYDIKNKTMRLSLLKSAEHPDTDADRGIQQFSYSLYTHTEPWYASELIPLAWDLNSPLIAAGGKFKVTDCIKISSGDIALDAIKQSEDGDDIIIRVHENHGGRTKLELDFTLPLSGWAESDLMEQPLGPYTASRSITRELLPFEIVTFRIKL